MLGIPAKPVPNKFLTIDMDSASIKCLAFFTPENESTEFTSIAPDTKAKIVGVAKHYLEPGVIRGGVIIDIDLVEKSLRECIDECTMSQEESIKDVIFGVSGNLSLNTITTAKITRPPHSPITENEMNSLYSKITRSAFTEIGNEVLRMTGDSDIDMEIITSETVYSKLDNKYVENPLNQTGNVLEVAYYTAFTHSYHVQALQKLAKKLGLKISAVGSEMHTLVNYLKMGKLPHIDCVIINIDNDFTDVGIVFGGGIVSTKALDFGAVDFVNEISQKTGLSFIEAEKFKRTYSYGKLSRTEADVVKSCITEVIDTWLEGLKVVFEEFTGVKTYPSKVYLVGDAAELPDIQETLDKEPWTKSIAFKAPPTYTKLTLRDLQGVTDSTGTLGSLEYVMNASLSKIYMEMHGIE
ncbi:hypothetical protein A3F07_00230 [candidate division WWE3 bacterium RIFCSPHIGHO2_12_FULL_38_15]|uniref:SHS2 domain-containing protein n=1 Tax=candidate division WWE3 bacterium RIFCSPHIGHO2_02_FULL_38_14 TaxID=1802620 RepID=A0A1F4V6E2_UNCKA|nr:MAG: hypothetical protein A2793_02160 [candidate division WWE3 bacterium RIFCSPHIGHO2_01_FULL_38_45]OGC49265.1 MAG: hypothetical protein A3F07_00230 [candidate division WWE3 bacterium RIFCSPHIGHO2_12_FULL_38_15]OGC52666.1 MAG: hypothetical protein A3D91_03275 [candidate division WWE3 bacterium RIFCSPHIGHO2_02_FULL_38_14]OGC53754.1 MAG: hypothetical protein A3B64_03505 [candidate division WWE3 bacterium RIFCSPLOWO2_01_FULL_37_24]HLB51299.1 hypothetical protein [Patescibacteria group bacterium